jgi:hypothetical protein
MPTVDHLLFLMENKAATWRIRLAAVSRAFKDLRRQLKGKRASIFKCTITITEKSDAEVQFIKEAETSERAL